MKIFLIIYNEHHMCLEKKNKKFELHWNLICQFLDWQKSQGVALYTVVGTADKMQSGIFSLVKLSVHLPFDLRVLWILATIWKTAHNVIHFKSICKRLWIQQLSFIYCNTFTQLQHFAVIRWLRNINIGYSHH